MSRPSAFFLLLCIVAAPAILFFSCSPENAASQDIPDTAMLARRIDTLVKQMNASVDNRDLLNAIRYCEEGLSLELQLPEEKRSYGDLHSRFGELLEDAGLYAYALDHFHKAIAASHKLKKDRYKAEYHKTARLSSFFFHRGNYDSAVFYMRQAIDAASKQPDRLWYASGYNNLGYQYEASGGSIDSASFYYGKAEATLRPDDHDDSLLLASIRDNMAHLLLAKKQYAAAETGYRNNEKLYALLHEENGRVKSLFNTVVVYQEARLYRQALDLADSTARVFHENLSRRIDVRRQFYELRYNQLLRLGKSTEAFAELQRIDTIKNSGSVLNRNHTDALLSRAASGELERHKSENEIRRLQLDKAVASSRFSWILGWVIFSASVIIVTVLILFFRKRSSDQRTKIKLTEAELRARQLEGEKLNHDLEMRKRDLTDMVLVNRQKKEILDELVHDLQEVLRSDDIETGLKRLLLDLRSRSGTTETLDLIGENIDVVNKAFYDKLEAQFPDLTKGERALCGLLRMNLSTKDIAQLRKIGPDSVKMAKKRLRRKLDLPPESDLYLFMQKI